MRLWLLILGIHRQCRHLFLFGRGMRGFWQAEASGAVFAFAFDVVIFRELRDEGSRTSAKLSQFL